MTIQELVDQSNKGEGEFLTQEQYWTEYTGHPCQQGESNGSMGNWKQKDNEGIWIYMWECLHCQRVWYTKG